ncbi:MAG: YigZ family protein [Clostridia bacterium]|nr:YigZ family protein [Clostridia bacterium]
MANNPYFSVEDRTMAEVEVNKSRFIAVAVHVESVEEVKEILGTLKKSNPNAAHIPYAYILGEDYSVAKNNDDGEPAGSAGMPIFESIRKANLTQTMVAVVRYFGGKELGKSRLTRTFGFIANEAVKNAHKYKMEFCTLFEMKVSYNDYASLGKVLSEKDLPIIERDFNESMPMIKCAIPVGTSEKVLEEIRARVREASSITKIGTGYYKINTQG